MFSHLSLFPSSRSGREAVEAVRQTWRYRPNQHKGGREEHDSIILPRVPCAAVYTGGGPSLGRKCQGASYLHAHAPKVSNSATDRDLPSEVCPGASSGRDFHLYLLGTVRCWGHSKVGQSILLGRSSTVTWATRALIAAMGALHFNAPCRSGHFRARYAVRSVSRKCDQSFFYAALECIASQHQDMASATRGEGAVW